MNYISDKATNLLNHLRQNITIKDGQPRIEDQVWGHVFMRVARPDNLTEGQFKSYLTVLAKNGLYKAGHNTKTVRRNNMMYGLVRISDSAS